MKVKVGGDLCGKSNRRRAVIFGDSYELSNIRGSVKEFTVGFFDFKNDRILHFESCKVSEPKVFQCVLGVNAENIAFIIYAGLAGATQGQWLIVEDVLICQCPFGGE